MNKWIWVSAVVALNVSCSGKSDKPGIIQPNQGGSVATGGRPSTGGQSETSTAGTLSTAGTAGTGGSARTGGGSSRDSGGTQNQGGTSALDLNPQVAIVSPVPVANPDVGPVVESQTIDVVCQATKAAASGAYDIAGSTVKITFVPNVGSPIEKSTTPVANQTNQYSASFSLSGLPNGPVSFQCKASDQAPSPHTATSSTVTSFIDHGPTISNVIPVANKAFPAKLSQHFAFQVAPAPLTAGDVGAVVGDVTLTINGYSYHLAANPATPGIYSQEVDFSDTTKFPALLTGQVGVQITAANTRTNPGPAAASQSYFIVLDGTPPVATISKPGKQAVIGGLTKLYFSVSDDLSGVDPAFVFVNLGTESATSSVPYQYSATDPAWTMKAGNPTEFTFTFDGTKFDSSDSQVTVSIKATDLAGNQATSETIFFYLDNAPPYVSLDPPDIRVVTTRDATTVNCSVPFDPIGTRPPASGMIVNSFEFYRAFALDRTNGKASQSIFYFSGIDATQVHLYLQPDPTKRIVYDHDGDGVCDSIDDDVKKMAFQPSMDAVNETGTANFNATDLTLAPDVTDVTSFAAGKSCYVSSNSPTLLCNGNSPDMMFVAHQPYATGSKPTNDAAVYALQVTQGALTCTGSDWDISKFVPAEGWVCLAAEVLDNIGNIGISAPISVCFDNELTPAKPSCATGKRWQLSTEKPPTCITDGCKAPSRGRDGDLTAGGQVTRYDVGNPIPFIIYTR